ncbi:hypothetical protein H0H92_001546 [Tricholoma furcatifolium]|nr:hypothetical protein H0H92_001546 [Tricholoma furcatifolium]
MYVIYDTSDELMSTHSTKPMYTTQRKTTNTRVSEPGAPPPASTGRDKIKGAYNILHGLGEDIRGTVLSALDVTHREAANEEITRQGKAEVEKGMAVFRSVSRSGATDSQHAGAQATRRTGAGAAGLEGTAEAATQTDQLETTMAVSNVTATDVTPVPSSHRTEIGSLGQAPSDRVDAGEATDNVDTGTGNNVDAGTPAHGAQASSSEVASAGIGATVAGIDAATAASRIPRDDQQVTATRHHHDDAITNMTAVTDQQAHPINHPSSFTHKTAPSYDQNKDFDIGGVERSQEVGYDRQNVVQSQMRTDFEPQNQGESFYGHKRHFRDERLRYSVSTAR